MSNANSRWRRSKSTLIDARFMEKEEQMRSWVEKVGMATATAVVCTALLSSPSHALTKCTASIRSKDGVILVNAAKVGGTLNWGTAQGAEISSFANVVTCVKGKSAVGCQLGAPGTVEQITPPQLCTVFLSDGVSSCSAHIRGCTPGVRGAGALSYVTCTGPSAPTGTASTCTATCPANTQIVSGVCANDSSAPQFAQGKILDPGTNTVWSCTVKNQNSASTPIAAEGVAICQPQ